MCGMGCALYMRCTLSIHQKECRKSLGCPLHIGARYLPENTVNSDIKLYMFCRTLFMQYIAI
jgi:hypothetical protein